MFFLTFTGIALAFGCLQMNTAMTFILVLALLELMFELVLASEVLKELKQ